MNENSQEQKESGSELPQLPEYNERTAILVKDLIIAVARTPAGPAIYSNFQSRPEMVNMMVEVNKEIVGKIAAYDIEARKSHIIPAKGNMRGFARKIFRR